MYRLNYGEECLGVWVVENMPISRVLGEEVEQQERVQDIDIISIMQ